jgi:hypothetical protein
MNIAWEGVINRVRVPMVWDCVHSMQAGRPLLLASNDYYGSKVYGAIDRS